MKQIFGKIDIDRCINLFLSGGIVLFVVSGCATQSPVPGEAGPTSYVSYTGSDIVKDQIKESFNSIKRLQNSVVYQNFVFMGDRLPTRAELAGADLQSIATDSYIDDHSNAGTAVVLSKGRRGAVIMTSSHVVTYPDTIWHYRSERLSGIDDPVEAVSIKQSSSHYILDDSSLLGFEVVANDTRRDLAVLMENSRSGGSDSLKPLNIEVGNHSALDWTDLVYAVGYPKGIRMVTSAMVSRFQISHRRSFILDASFNRGFSGGVIFTVKSDGSGLNWVGVLSAAYAEPEYFLAPIDVDAEDYNLNTEYTGPVFIKREARINYGITYAVGMDEVGSFFRENQTIFRELGISVPDVPR